jgi:hypothetical protein
MSDSQDEIMALLADGRMMTTKEIQDATGYRNTYHKLVSLHRFGMVERVDLGPVSGGCVRQCGWRRVE